MKEHELKLLSKKGIRLSDLQKLGLSQAENYGWHLLSDKPIEPSKGYVIVVNNESRIGFLKPDGTIEVRDEELPVNPFDEDSYSLH